MLNTELQRLENVQTQIQGVIEQTHAAVSQNDDLLLLLSKRELACFFPVLRQPATPQVMNALYFDADSSMLCQLISQIGVVRTQETGCAETTYVKNWKVNSTYNGGSFFIHLCDAKGNVLHGNVLDTCPDILTIKFESQHHPNCSLCVQRHATPTGFQVAVGLSMIPYGAKLAVRLNGSHIRGSPFVIKYFHLFSKDFFKKKTQHSQLFCVGNDLQNCTKHKHQS